ncbi:MAG: cytochrome c3 family protein [Planctomycetota bacterium]
MRAEDAAAAAEGRAPKRVVSDELRKLYAYVGGVPGEPAPEGGAPAAKPIPWVKVHNVPDYAYFDHRPHVAAGVDCQHCHGPVETMERLRQVGDLSMGWCVNCHRDVRKTGLKGKALKPSSDCTACHY